ncbi:MAG: aldehyde dehydrogenase family protein, partial [Pseudomonadota bacterium]|nr:aldehyde dehydrogenase family protein [Pseudomonadota bacterium]
MEHSLIIGGQRVAPEATFDVINPATAQVIAHCPQGSVQDLDAAVAAARAALPLWSAT